MWVWRDRQEKLLLGAALLVLVLIVLINLKLDLWPVLEGGRVAAFLRADATASVSSDLLVGLFSAYIFYVIVELVPRLRKDETTLKPLNMIIASIVDAFERGTVFGHETPISSIDTKILAIDNLKERKKEISQDRIPLTLKLKCAMETAHSRYPDLQHSLSLAASISPEHALEWLVLTDKVRLLAECYDQWPVNPYADNPLGELTELQRQDPDHIQRKAQHDLNFKNYYHGLRQRVHEVIEATVFWMERQSL